MTAPILVSRGARSLAYGALTVQFAQALSTRGNSAFAIGTLITIALLSGAIFSAWTGTLVRRFGARTTFATSGVMMIVAAALLAGGTQPAIVLACVLGVVSPGGQDVGPCAAVEQVALAMEERALTRRLSWYNIVGAVALAVGALTAAVVSFGGVLIIYGAAGFAVVIIALMLPRISFQTERADSVPKRFGVVERLAALFALDAFAGGFVVQAFIAYWFFLRFGVGSETIGPLLFGANLLAAASFLFADYVAARIGLLQTMVFTHLPSNVLLCLVPLMPTLPLAATVLLARFALSQMDVPTRQAYTLSLVPPHDRARAAGVTAAVRPAAASAAPVLTGLAFQVAALGLPFLIAGGLKIAYDVMLLSTFRNVSLKR